MSERLVHLVRHGAVENPDGVIYGRLPGFALSARGREQAEAAAQRVAALSSGPIALVASPLQRAQESAAILAQHLAASEVATDERFIEAHGPFDGRKRHGPVGQLVRQVVTPSAWRAAETPTAVLRRMRDGVLATPADRSVVIVSHQFPIRMARVAFEHASSPIAARVPWLFVRGKAGIGSVTTLVFRGDVLREIVEWHNPV